MQKDARRSKKPHKMAIFYLVVGVFLLIGLAGYLFKFLSGDRTFLNSAGGIGFLLMFLIIFSLYRSTTTGK
jgi:hypothetical protein